MNESTTWKAIVAAFCDPDVPFHLPRNDLYERYAADPDGFAAHREALEAALSRHADTERMISYRRYCIHHQSTPDDPLLALMFRTLEFLYAQLLSLEAFEAFLSDPRLSVLTTLNLNGLHKPDQKFAAALASASHLRNLTHLGMGSGPIRTGGFKALAQAPHLSTLRSLRMNRASLTKTFAKHLTAKSSLTNLESLIIHSSNFGDGGAISLAKHAVLPNLKVLDLYGNDITAAGAAALAGWPGLQTVEELNLKYNRIKVDGCVALAASPHVGRLRVLNLDTNNHLQDEGAKALADNPKMAALEALHVEGNRLTADGCRALAGSPHLKNLRRLFLGEAFTDHIGGAGIRVLLSTKAFRLEELKFSLIDMPNLVEVLAGQAPTPTALTRLTLYRNTLTGEGLSALLTAFPSPHLSHLSLLESKVGAVGGRALAKADLRQLEELDLNQTALTDDGLLTLAGAALPRLHTLRIGACRLTGAGLAALRKAPWFAGLRTLELDGTGWSDPAHPLGNRYGAAALIALVNDPNVAGLRSITLSGKQITPAVQQAITDSPHLARQPRADLLRYAKY